MLECRHQPGWQNWINVRSHEAIDATVLVDPVASLPARLIMTDQGIIDVDWNVFTGNVTYVAYHSVHGVEIHRNSIFDSWLGRGDVSIHLADSEEEFRLIDAAHPDEIAEYVQGAVADLKSHDVGHEEPEEIPDDREPFQILLDTLTEMVKDHLAKKGPTETPEERKMAEEILKQAKRRTSTIDLSSGKLPEPEEDHGGHDGDDGDDGDDGHG